MAGLKLSSFNCKCITQWLIEALAQTWFSHSYILASIPLYTWEGLCFHGFISAQAFSSLPVPSSSVLAEDYNAAMNISLGKHLSPGLRPVLLNRNQLREISITSSSKFSEMCIAFYIPNPNVFQYCCSDLAEICSSAQRPGVMYVLCTISQLLEIWKFSIQSQI